MDARQARCIRRRRWRGLSNRVLAGLIASLVLGLDASPWPSTAAAEVAELINLDVEDLLDMRVVAASRHDQRSSQAPSAVTVITADEIRAYGYRTLADILRGSVGFYTTYDRNYSYLGVRGFGLPGDYNTRVLLLVDGTRVNDNIYGLAPIGTDFILDVASIDRVEIVRGPGAALYGANAFFGVVNVITPNPGAVEGVRARGSVGSAGTFAGRGSYAHSGASAQWLLCASMQESEGKDLYYSEFDDPSTKHGRAEGMDDDRFRGFEAKLARGKLSGQLIYAGRDKRIPTASFGSVFGDGRARTVDDRSLVVLNWDHEPASGIAYQLHASRGQYVYEGSYPFEYGTPESSQVVVNDDGCDGIWYTGEAIVSVPVRKHRFTLGSELRHSSRQDQWNRDDFGSILEVAETSSNWGAFVQAEAAIGTRLQLIGGVRHDRYETFGGTTNPRLAAIVAAPARVRVKLLYGTAFRAPNEYELRYYGFQAGLEPETISTRELILERPLWNRAEARVSLFDNDTHGLIRLTPTTEGDEDFRFVNADAYDAEGMEIEVRGSQGAVRGRLRFSHVNVEDRSTGKSPPNSASNTAGFNVAVLVPRTSLTVASEVRHTGSRPTIHGSVDGHWISDLAFTAAAKQERIHASLSLQNVFDAAYADPGSEEHLQEVIPQDGRSVRFFIELRF